MKNVLKWRFHRCLSPGDELFDWVSAAPGNCVEQTQHAGVCQHQRSWALSTALAVQSESASEEDGELDVAEDGLASETKKERRLRQQKEKQVRILPLWVLGFQISRFFLLLSPRMWVLEYA